MAATTTMQARAALAAALSLGLALAPAQSRAQDGPPPAAAAREPARDATRDATREATRWDLPRIFYDARQRRSLDAQDRAIRMGLSADGAGPSGPRFDGWVSGPTGTHAWVSGTRYVADRSGRLRAADDHATAGADALEDGAARLDRARGVLVVRRETEGALHLRVGEADNPMDPAAVPASGAEPRP